MLWGKGDSLSSTVLERFVSQENGTNEVLNLLQYC